MQSLSNNIDTNDSESGSSFQLLQISYRQGSKVSIGQSIRRSRLAGGLKWLSRLPPVSFSIVSKDEESWIWMVRSLLPVGHLSLWRALLTTRRASLSWSLGLECAHIQRCAVLWFSFSSDAQALNPLGWTWGLSVSGFLHVTRKISEMRLSWVQG